MTLPADRILVEDLTDDQISYYMAHVLSQQPRSRLKGSSFPGGLPRSDRHGDPLPPFHQIDRVQNVYNYVNCDLVYDHGSPGLWTASTNYDRNYPEKSKSSSDVMAERALAKAFLKYYYAKDRYNIDNNGIETVENV